MARYVDIDKARIYVSDFVCEQLKKIPTAAVVEIPCRCRDCKHYQRYGRTSLVFEGKNIRCGWCMLRAKFDEEHRMLPTDFCSYGERAVNYESSKKVKECKEKNYDNT